MISELLSDLLNLRSQAYVRKFLVIMPASLVKIGIRLIGAGVLVFALDYFRHYRYSSYLLTHLGGYILSGLFVLVGIGFIVYGVVVEKEKG